MVAGKTKRKNKQPLNEAIKIEWLKDCSVYRVRRTDWPHDSFEVVEWREFAQIESVCKKFTIPFEEIVDED